MGKETAASSKDQILKEEMPLAFTRVEESSILLVEASQILRKDPYSSAARKKLIDGARGNLNIKTSNQKMFLVLLSVRSTLFFLPVVPKTV